MSILKQVQGEKNFHEIINFRRKLKVFGKYSEPAKMNDSELAFFTSNSFKFELPLIFQLKWNRLELSRTTQSRKSLLKGIPGNMVDLLVRTSSDQLLLITKILFYF
jgi:hypothetical protein